MRLLRARLLLTAFCLPIGALAAACSVTSPPAPPADPAQPQLQAGYAATAAPVPPSPTVASGAAFPVLDEAPAADLPGRLSQLDRAEQALDVVLGARGRGGEIEVKTDAAKSPTAVGPSQWGPAVPLSQENLCSVACTALASMKRSAEHVCSMAGEGDSQCSGARTRVTRAEERVTAACPACSK